MRRKQPSSRGFPSPTSGDSPEKIYATPDEDDRDWHSESPPRKSLSPASKKREHSKFEAELDALSSHSSDPEAPEIFDPIGKTPEEIAAWCAEYERKNRRIRVERQRAGIAGINHATLMYLTCTNVMLAAIHE